MTDSTRWILGIIALGMFLGYQAYSLTLANRTDPDLKDGVRCLIEQLAEHRVGSRGADDAAAKHHGYEYNPEAREGYNSPPKPTGDPSLCKPFLGDE